MHAKDFSRGSPISLSYYFALEMALIMHAVASRVLIVDSCIEFLTTNSAKTLGTLWIHSLYLFRYNGTGKKKIAVDLPTYCQRGLFYGGEVDLHAAEVNCIGDGRREGGGGANPKERLKFTKRAPIFLGIQQRYPRARSSFSGGSRARTGIVYVRSGEGKSRGQIQTTGSSAVKFGAIVY